MRRTGSAEARDRVLREWALYRWRGGNREAR